MGDDRTDREETADPSDKGLFLSLQVFDSMQTLRRVLVLALVLVLSQQ